MKTTFHTLSHYDSKTIRLHWLTAGLVIALWCLGQTIDWFPCGLPRIFARSSHITAGAALALLLAYRMYWRLTAGLRLPALGRLDHLARPVHLLLYVGLIAAVVAGLANTWVRGDNLFTLFRIPALDSGNRALRGQVEEVHALAANLLLMLSALHAAAGLAHHYLLKDGVLRRMWPGLGQR